MNFEPETPNHKQYWVGSYKKIARAREMKSRSPFSSLLILAYRHIKLRSLCFKLCEKLENGQFYSATMREILKTFHNVEIGKYSYGSIWQPRVLPSGTKVGAYCSVGQGLIVRRRNHPIERLTQHPFFYNKQLGYLVEDSIHTDHSNPLTIGHDVWIGDRVTILSGCRTIGNGAVLAAGTVVTRDILPYSVNGGVPAKVLKMRFPKELIDLVEASHWWEKSIVELLEYQADLIEPVSQSFLDRLISEESRD